MESIGEAVLSAAFTGTAAHRCWLWLMRLLLAILIHYRQDSGKCPSPRIQTADKASLLQAVLCSYCSFGDRATVGAVSEKTRLQVGSVVVEGAGLRSSESILLEWSWQIERIQIVRQCKQLSV
jgi:hypothetical protein